MQPDATKDANPSRKTVYTTEQKAEALMLLAEVGKAEAARRTGIPSGTIASWGSREGVQAPTPEAMRPQVEARQLSLATRRQALGEKFLTKAEELLACVGGKNQPAMDRKRGVEAARIAAETAQLLTGQPTSRVDAQLGTDQERALAIVKQLDEHRRSA